jgi:TolB-like protein
MKRRVLLAALAVPFATAPVSAQNTHSTSAAKHARVAVMDFTDGGSFGKDPQDLAKFGKTIGTMMVSELNERGVAIIEREHIDALIEEYKLGLSGMMDQGTAVKLGKMLGVDYLVFGTYSDVMSRVRIDVRVVDVATGGIPATANHHDDRERLYEIVERLAAQLLEEADFEQSAGAPSDVPAVSRAKPPAQAILRYSEALAYEQRGDRTKAAEAYRQALAIFPAYQAASQRLAAIGR